MTRALWPGQAGEGSDWWQMQRKIALYCTVQNISTGTVLLFGRDKRNWAQTSVCDSQSLFCVCVLINLEIETKGLSNKDIIYHRNEPK